MLLLLPQVPKKVPPSIVALAVLLMAFIFLTPPHGVLRCALYFESYYAIGIGTRVVAAVTSSGLQSLLAGELASPPRLIALAKKALFLVSVSGLFIMLVGINDFGSGPAIRISSEGVIVWSVLPITAAGAAITSLHRETERRLGAIAVAITSAMWFVVWTMYRVDAVHRTDLSRPAPISAAIERSDPLARITGLDSATLQGNSATVWAIHDPKLSGAFYTCRYLELMSRASDPSNTATCEDLSESINANVNGTTARAAHLTGISTILYAPTRAPAFPDPPLDASLA